jgi:hypothetical protein
MELSDIKIPIPKIGKNLGQLYKSITSIHKSLKKYDIIYSKKQITNTQQISIIKIIKYLYDNNLLDNSIKLEQHASFKKILESNDLNELNNWINNNGTEVMDRVNQLSNANKIPVNLQNPFIDNMLINQFVEMNIIDYLLNQLDYKHSYKIEYRNLEINLVIYSKTKTISKKILNSIIDRIVVLGLYKSKSTKIKINIDIFMTPFKKRITTDTKILGTREVNSGFSVHNYKICIFRKEELNKVLVHELIHYLELDLNVVEFADFYNYFNVAKSNEIRLNEAYTEILAVLINSIIKAKNITECKKILNLELKFSLYQVGKILNLYDFMNAKDFFKPNDNEKFKQNTSVFSYFIIKTILLFNLDIFLELYYSGKIHKYNFKDIVLSIIDHDLIGIIDTFINHIKTRPKDKALFNTLKMTYYD